MTFETGVNPQQLEYFHRRLLTWRDELTTELTGTAYEGGEKAFFMGQAANAPNSCTSFQAQDREQKLIHKIDAALNQIEAGNYGILKA